METRPGRKRLRRVVVRAALTVALFLAVAVTIALNVGHPVPAIDRPLMPTPVLYHGGVDPFTGVPASLLDQRMSLFYATDRQGGADTPSGYGQTPGDVLSLGVCDLEVVADATPLKDLLDATLLEPREHEISLRLDAVHPLAAIDLSSKAPPPPDEALRPFFDALNASLHQHRDRTLNIFIHGAIMPFADAMTMAADYHHFCGRRSTWISFAWPAHLYLYQYALGEDNQRIIDSAYHLARLLELLGQYSDARDQHRLLDAGGSLMGDCLFQLQELNPDMTPQEVRAKTRLGHIVFCSSDESFSDFTTRMKSCHDIPRGVTYTLTDSDRVLEISALVRDDSQRVGHADSDDLQALSDLLRSMPNVAVLDVSYAKQQRGFDITGHHLWINQPWVSSDIILNLLSDRPPNQRGLDPTPHPNIWCMTERYPGQVQAVAKGYFAQEQ